MITLPPEDLAERLLKLRARLEAQGRKRDIAVIDEAITATVSKLPRACLAWKGWVGMEHAKEDRSTRSNSFA